MQFLLIGKPNSGKSLLFNRITGLQQKVANFPGVTVDIKKGSGPSGSTIIDFPGTYSLNPLTKDEKIAVEKFKEALSAKEASAIVCILDATRLQRSLMVGLQALKIAKDQQHPIVFVLNMIDATAPHGSIDAGQLGNELGAKVLAVSARNGQGMQELIDHLKKVADVPTDYIPHSTSYNTNLVPAEIAANAKKLDDQYGIKAEYILKNQNSWDRFFLSNTLGILIFIAIMAILFQSIFTWAAPLMDLVEGAVNQLGEAVTGLLPDGVFRDFVKDAIFGGVGSFLVFVPQIFMLTFIIGILEDSGYLARATIICHKPLSLFGLTGKSFVPLLSGFACAIPAMSAARTIESPKRRLLTLAIIPLMACSARLPVYSLLISAFIAPVTFAGGMIGYQGLAFFGLYAFGLITAMIVSAIASKTAFKKEGDAPFILELPPYRLPHWLPLLRRSIESAKSFITKAGAVIFTVSVVVWILGYFPNGNGQLSTSWLAYMGQWIEPVFKPLGLDWRYGVAILTSFVAREVFVGTLGTLFGIEAADENIGSLADKIQHSGFSFASGISLLVFYAIALQCASTVAVLKKESGSWKLPLATLFGYGFLAYALAYAAQLIF